MGSQVTEHNRYVCEKIAEYAQRTCAADTLQHRGLATKLLECYILIKRQISGSQPILQAHDPI